VPATGEGATPTGCCCCSGGDGRGRDPRWRLASALQVEVTRETELLKTGATATGEGVIPGGGRCCFFGDGGGRNPCRRLASALQEPWQLGFALMASRRQTTVSSSEP
jgi:hypothetical protein